jgi:hypothetical protein
MVLAAVASLLLSTPSSSAPGDPLPGRDDLPRGVSSAEGVVTSSQGAVVRRSKMYITIGSGNPMWGALFTPMFNTPVEAPTTFLGLCSRGRPCLPDPFYQPACATDDLATQRRGNYFRSLLYPMARLKGGGVDVGLVATTRVNLIAFGSIPASATLTLRAPRVDGRVKPFTIHVWGISQGGCDPDWVFPTSLINRTLAEGQVVITLSDLQVDGVPVELGRSCRTVRPVDLRLWHEGQVAAGGYSPGGGGDLGAYDGLHPGSQAPLDSPYYQEDDGRTIPASTGVTVPPFTGCGTRGEDLSPLVTAMASGPNNPVRISQSPIIPHEGGLDLGDLERCQTNGVICPLPGPDAPERPPLPEGDE